MNKEEIVKIIAKDYEVRKRFECEFALEMALKRAFENGEQSMKKKIEENIDFIIKKLKEGKLEDISVKNILEDYCSRKTKEELARER